MTPGKNGQWAETVLHAFNGRDGYGPQAGLVLDAAGHLYGTTSTGGRYSHCSYFGECGTVFELASGRNGKWREKVLHNFNGKDGAFPDSTLTFDTAGNLYGTTYMGGVHDFGTAFQLMPGKNGKWKERVLYSLGSGKDGDSPASGLIIDGAGNLYGTAEYGGNHGGYCPPGCGTVFEITP